MPLTGAERQRKYIAKLKARAAEADLTWLGYATLGRERSVLEREMAYHLRTCCEVRAELERKVDRLKRRLRRLRDQEPA